jgi:hypothetical protein
MKTLNTDGITYFEYLFKNVSFIIQENVKSIDKKKPINNPTKNGKIYK